MLCDLIKLLVLIEEFNAAAIAVWINIYAFNLLLIRSNTLLDCVTLRGIVLVGLENPSNG